MNHHNIYFHKISLVIRTVLGVFDVRNTLGGFKLWFIRFLEEKRHVWEQEEALKDTFFLIHFTVQSSIRLKKQSYFKYKMTHGGRGEGGSERGKKVIFEWPLNESDLQSPCRSWITRFFFLLTRYRKLLLTPEVSPVLNVGKDFVHNLHAVGTDSSKVFNLFRKIINLNWIDAENTLFKLNFNWGKSFDEEDCKLNDSSMNVAISLLSHLNLLASCQCRI